MTEYNLEPLVIELSAPKGNYEITVTVISHSDTVFSVYEDNAGYITQNREIRKGENTDIKFKTSADDGIAVIIYCDGDITATAMAEYIN